MRGLSSHSQTPCTKSRLLYATFVQVREKIPWSTVESMKLIDFLGGHVAERRLLYDCQGTWIWLIRPNIDRKTGISESALKVAMLPRRWWIRRGGQSDKTLWIRHMYSFNCIEPGQPSRLLSASETSVFTIRTDHTRIFGFSPTTARSPHVCLGTTCQSAMLDRGHQS